MIEGATNWATEPSSGGALDGRKPKEESPVGICATCGPAAGTAGMLDEDWATAGGGMDADATAGSLGAGAGAGCGAAAELLSAGSVPGPAAGGGGGAAGAAAGA